jgi:MFS family permease
MEIPASAADSADSIPTTPAILDPTPPRWRIGTFRSLRHRNYRLYFIGQVVSLTGTWMQNAALALLAYELTGLSAWTARIMAAQLVPMLVLGGWGGALADRYAKRTIIFVSQAVMLVLALALAGLVMMGQANPELMRSDAMPWLLLLIAALNGIVGAIDLPARLAFVMDMVGREDLANAVALNSLMFNVARALGPAAGAITYTRLGPAHCFLLNALSYVAVLIGLAMMDIDGRPKPRQGRRRSSLRAGFHYLANHRNLLLLLLLSSALAVFGWPTLTLLPALANVQLYAKPILHLLASAVGAGSQSGWQVLPNLPTLADVQLQAKETYGMLVSAVGVGALFAALLVATFNSRTWQKLFLASGVVLTMAALAGLAYVDSFVSAAAWCTLLGLGLILFFPTGQAIMQLGASDENRGVIMGIWSMLLGGAVPLGGMLSGEAADRFGVANVLMAEAAGIALAAAIVLAAALARRPPETAAVPDVPIPR